MSAPCSDSFSRLAAFLGGFGCEGANPLVTLRSPGALAHGSMPVVEAIFVVGAVLGLAHAIRLHRRGDVANLALYVAAATFVFALEPPLYFPHQLGYADRLDVIFVHNVFSVQFLYDRLPLYIVALYPSGIYLSVVLVERLSVFERRGRLVGALTVGFVHHCFYEIFDHVGPQLRWWAWNEAVPLNAPALASVPLVSVVIFGIAAPAALAYVWRAGIAEPVAARGSAGIHVGLRAVGLGLLSPVLISLAGAPFSAALMVPHPNRPLVAAVLYSVVVVVGAVAIRAIASARDDVEAASGDAFVDRYPIVYGGVYLLGFAGIWLAAAPAYLAARGGITADGTPIGSAAYALACAAVCVFTLVRAARSSAERRATPALA